MKIKYEFANETIEIEVEDSWGEVVLELDREEDNADRRETRRHCSLDVYNPGEVLLPSDVDAEDDVIRRLEAERFHAAIAKLKPRHRRLIYQVYFEGRSYAEIARQEQLDRSSVRKATETAIKKLKNILKKLPHFDVFVA